MNLKKDVVIHLRILTVLSKAFLFFLILVLFDCSSLSRNYIQTGELTLRGGVYNSQRWSDRLNFDRYSWFEELTLVFDLLLVPVDKSSPFYYWFSTSEKEALARCEKAFIYLNYVQDSDKISKGMFLKQMEKFGYSKIAITSFKQHLRMHPSYSYLSLKLYNTAALCLDKFEAPFKGEALVIRFPGFNEIRLRR